MGTINQARVSHFIEFFQGITVWVAWACRFFSCSLFDMLNGYKSYEMVFLHKQFNMPNGFQTSWKRTDSNNRSINLIFTTKHVGGNKNYKWFQRDHKMVWWTHIENEKLEILLWKWDGRSSRTQNRNENVNPNKVSRRKIKIKRKWHFLFAMPR